MPGGYEEEKLQKLVKIAKDTKSKTVLIEKNFGHGAHANMIKPLFEADEWPVELIEVYETGQKELRIIDVIEPLLTSHRLIISPEAIEHDYLTVRQYPPEVQVTYRLMHQLGMITRDRGCLRHDDRADALAGAIRHVVEQMDFDTKLVHDERKRREMIEAINAWADPTTRRTWLKNVAIVAIDSQKQNTAGRNIFAGMGGSRRATRSGKRRNRFG
jgi:hypothetical protein